MLTDEELTGRLSAAFHESVPELTYVGPVPRVRGNHAGLVATSALAAAAALVLTPAALQRDAGRAPEAVPTTHAQGHHVSKQKVLRALHLAGLDLSNASVDQSPGPMYFAGPDGLAIPPDAEKLDLGLPVDVYFVAHPASEEPQVYISYQACPDTTEGCNGGPVPTHTYGVLAPGWTRQQLIDFLEHPVRTERDSR